MPYDGIGIFSAEAEDARGARGEEKEDRIMAFWDKVGSQFIDVIEWLDDTQDTLVWRYPRYDNEIKNGAQLIVRESQMAVFVHEGEMGDVFKPGRVELTTSNIPILTTLKSWKYAFDAPFKCEVYFINTKQFTDQKWGTANPIMLRDPEFGPVRLRAFGTYCFRAKDPVELIRQIVGTDGVFQIDEVNEQLRNMIVSRFTDALGESRIAALDLAANYDEIGAMLQKKIGPEFEEYGLELTKFLLENISFPPEVEAALDQRAKMGVLGNMQQYTQMKTADAIGDMANNPGGGGNMMGMIAGMGMGGVVTGAMNAGAQNMQQGQGGEQPPVGGGTGAPPPLPQAAAWYAGINGRQAGPFDANALQQHIASGQVTRETLLWKQGMANWTPAGQVQELAPLFNAPPPMPGTPPSPPPAQ
jgi:membrane protease subunit (stomatin/prohibitin family)